MTVNPLAAGSGAMILDSQFQITLTAIGQPLVASTNDSALLAGPQSAVYVPIYADYASQPGTIIGFVYYNNWSYHERQSDARPGCRRRANWRSKRVADDGLAAAGGARSGGRFRRCFRTMRACSPSTRSMPRRWSTVTSARTHPIPDLQISVSTHHPNPHP